MKVASKSVGPCRLELKIQADSEETQDTYQDVRKRYAREGRVPGFRPGKAPMEVVARRYGDAIRADTQDMLVRRFYREALREQGIEPVAVLNVKDVAFAPASGIRFAVELDVPPDFKLPKYQGLPLKDETRTIGEEQVTERLEQFRRMMARYEPKPDTPIEAGDVARITYEAHLDGQPVGELAPDAGVLLESKDRWVQADDQDEVPGLGRELIGLKSGDTREVTIAYPKDHPVKALGGKSVCYPVTVGEVRQQLLPDMDADFFKRLGFDDEAAMRASLLEELKREAEQAEQARRRESVASVLLRKSRFDLPESVVQDELRMTLQSMIQDIMRRGGDQETLKANRDALVQSAREASEDRVRLNYILLRIAREESIEVSDQEVAQRIDFLAARNRMSSAKLRDQLDKRNGLERLESEIRAQKAMAWVLEQAKIS